MQYYFLQFNGGEEPTERRLSYFPHPYPSVKDLQKEIVRWGLHATCGHEHVQWKPAGACRCHRKCAV